MYVSRTRQGGTLLFLAFVIAGCLPSSCSRTESRDLLPSDSLSRALATTLPVDTLSILDTLRPEDPLFSYPRTVSYARDGKLFVSDTKTHRILGFAKNGTLSDNFRFGELEYPFVAGFRADTLIVFTPANPRILLIADGAIVRTVPVPEERPVGNGFQYVTAFDKGYYYKVIDENFPGYVVRLNNSGDEVIRWALPGHFWRYAGALKMWSDSLMSLSGYLPQLHIIRHDSGFSSRVGDRDAERMARPDSLVLRGFDSPMLPRTRQFLTGEQDQPPLLSASAAAAGERLFVLNMRPGWLQVDVYGRDGELDFILTQPAPEFNTEYYPTDIAVRMLGPADSDFVLGERVVYEIAVTVVEPVARVDRFRWQE
jgi:hypothetical protein